MNPQRRHILQLGASAAASSLLPANALGADAPGWKPELFKATTLEDIARQLGLTLRESKAVSVDGPNIAEIGAAVPVEVRASAAGVDMLGIAVPKNPVALVGLFYLEPTALPKIATRIKMAQSSDVYALARSGNTLLFSKKLIKVTVGGCG
jgi:sulfur-oxidizing protein SoxY